MKRALFLGVLGALIVGCSGGGEETPPVALTIEGGMTIGGNHLRVFGNYAYIATNEHKLSIIDISSVSTPSEKGFYENANLNFYDVDVAGGMAYTVANNSGAGALFAIDVSDAANPTIKGFVLTTDLWGIAVDGNNAFIAAGDSGLFVYDISNAASMSRVASLRMDTANADVREIWKFGDYLYLTGPYGGTLWVVDVSDPASPAVVDTFSLLTADVGEDVYATGSVGLVSGGSNIYLLDISDPSSVSEKAHASPPDGDAYAAWYDGTYTYVAAKLTGQAKSYVSVMDGSLAEVAGSDPISGSPTDICYDGNFCYILTDESMFILRVEKQ